MSFIALVLIHKSDDVLSKFLISIQGSQKCIKCANGQKSFLSYSFLVVPNVKHIVIVVQISNTYGVKS